MAHLNQVILVLGTHFYPVNTFSKQNRAMYRGMGKPQKLKVRCYAACII